MSFVTGWNETVSFHQDGYGPVPCPGKAKKASTRGEQAGTARWRPVERRLLPDADLGLVGAAQRGGRLLPRRHADLTPRPTPRDRRAGARMGATGTLPTPSEVRGAARAGATPACSDDPGPPAAAAHRPHVRRGRPAPASRRASRVDRSVARGSRTRPTSARPETSSGPDAGWSDREVHGVLRRPPAARDLDASLEDSSAAHSPHDELGTAVATCNAGASTRLAGRRIEPARPGAAVRAQGRRPGDQPALREGPPGPRR